ncbi:uncharacterized protein (UPF0332 family) [Roseiarcus fermentans]|uniref:Uncharacterized protein (UPF0332 family) n=1 Tax=Roseiarcus fermentans TaxID=1473586 RepID=A0A366EQI9_9HYPH|nr:HEPN domain-containing protein [Roseiarcus fermentans]RBP03769.1 uncharacterized protein (UPF0332 family) [Roseiarcus fermentans]
MTALPAAYLEKAAQSLREARAVAEIGYYQAAGRAAYLAAFHAAQALILARTDKVAKTHSGVRSEFSRLVKDDPAMERGLTAFLARAYRMKVAADYTVGADEEVGKSEATEAIESATRFVEAVERALSGP